MQVTPVHGIDADLRDSADCRWSWALGSVSISAGRWLPENHCQESDSQDDAEGAGAVGEGSVGA